ncbi:MAG: hypothetical protein JWQ48_4293 [Conexibacter sp.]|jgi:hypothetical protein|nr:hypothetical protein [Conexibacter sp.]
MDPIDPIVARAPEPGVIAPSARLRPVGRGEREQRRRERERARPTPPPPDEHTPTTPADGDDRPHVDLRA